MLKFKIAKWLFPIEEEKNEYRYFGCPFRQKVKNWKRMEELINFHNGKDNCYISLASYDPNLNLELVFFDLDGDQALNDTYDLSVYLDEKKYVPYFIISSGNGYHILLKIRKEYISRNEYNLFHNKILSEIEIESFDNHIKGDVSRMIRIPDTMNLKSNTKCNFLGCNEYDLSDLAKISLRDEVKDFNSMDIEIEFSNYENFENDISYSLHEFPCLEKKMMVREPAHIDRVLYVSSLINQKYSDIEIYRKLKSFNWIDWESQITLYQIKNIRMNKPSSSPTCRMLKKRGLCDYSCEKYKK